MTIGFITIEEKAVLSAFSAVSIHFGRHTSIHRQQPGKTLIKFIRNHPCPNSPRDPSDLSAQLIVVTTIASLTASMPN